jgi:tetratricopeptide (TPR) repeat protein
VASDGTDCTPVSQKTQAVLALLATAPGFRRTRVWLCDKLWSDRDPEHAAGSLRQSLSEIRRSLGAAAPLLGADRRTVWLDRQSMTVDRTGPGDFLEGMDIRDPEWEDWLRERRSEEDTTSPPQSPGPTVVATVAAAVQTDAGPPLVALSVPKATEANAVFLARNVGQLLARNLSETAGIKVQMDDTGRAALSLSLMPQIGRSGPFVSLALRRRPDGAHLWSAGRAILSDGVPRKDDLPLHMLLAEAQDEVTNHCAMIQPAGRKDSDVATEIQRAARRIMAYDTRRMPEIEARLEAISDAAPSPAALGWLLLLKRIMFYERAAIATPEWIERLIRRCEEAIAVGNTNSFTMAAVSGIYLRLAGRPAEAVELARRAHRINDTNPFALDALASAMYLTGQIEQGYRLSLVARTLTANTSYSHFFDMSLSLASLLTGRQDQAAALTDAALSIAPDFRAAWRTRIVLCASRGDLGGAADAGERLKRIEPGFTVDRLIRDPDYPIVTLRQTCAPGLGMLGEIV